MLKALGVAGVAILLFVGCGGGDTNRTTYIEVGSGSDAIYLVSPNMDPSSWSDDASSHKVDALPSGSVQVCTFKTSQGVEHQVWSIGTAGSTQFARALCEREGQ